MENRKTSQGGGVPKYKVNDFGLAVEDEALDAKGSFRVRLASCGNIDHGDNPFQQMPGAGSNQWQSVTSLREASKACSKFINANEMGSGNWDGGEVLDGAGQMVARVSYNGCVWARTPEAKVTKSRGMGM